MKIFIEREFPHFKDFKEKLAENELFSSPTILNLVNWTMKIVKTSNTLQNVASAQLSAHIVAGIFSTFRSRH